MSKDEEVSPVIFNSTEVRFTRLQIMKNVSVLCAGFFIFFIAFDCLIMLQSTMNHEKGVGAICQTIYMAFFCISSLLTPKYIISKFGCKLTLVVSMSLYLPFVVANLYPKLFLLLITAIINGIAAPLLWSSQSQYLNEMAFLYASLSEKRKDKTLESFCTIDGQSNIVETDRRCDNCTCADVKSNGSFLNLSDFKNHQTLFEEKNKKIEYTNTTFISSPKQIEASAQDGIKTIYSEKRSHQSKEEDIFKFGAPQDPCIDINVSTYDQVHVSNYSQTKANEKTDDIAVSPHKMLSVSARFFGVFGMVYLSPRMFSNLMSYFILQKGNSAIDFLNSTCTCGAQFCNEMSDCFMKNLHVPKNENRNLLLGLCIALSVSGIVLLALFLDPLIDRNLETKFSLRVFSATFNLLKKKKIIFLTPICVYFGMMEGFFIGDFTMSFVGCAWGTFHVGLVSACYGATCAISSSTSGFLIKYVGRAPVIIFALVLNALVEIVLLVWKPNANYPTLFFVVSGLWGISVGTLLSQLKAMFGFLFKKDKEVSFAVFFAWVPLGYAISMAYSNHLCTYVKIYVLISVLILAAIGYICVEISLWKKSK